MAAGLKRQVVTALLNQEQVVPVSKTSWEAKLIKMRSPHSVPAKLRGSSPPPLLQPAAAPPPPHLAQQQVQLPQWAQQGPPQQMQVQPQHPTPQQAPQQQPSVQLAAAPPQPAQATPIPLKPSRPPPQPPHTLQVQPHVTPPPQVQPQPKFTPTEIANMLIIHGGDFSQGKVIVKRHDAHIYICLGLWHVGDIPELAGVTVDIHISLMAVSIGIPGAADNVEAAVAKQWAKLVNKQAVEHCAAKFHSTIPPWSKPNYTILDVLVHSPFHQSLFILIQAGLSAISHPGLRDDVKKKTLWRKNFHAPIQPWSRPPPAVQPAAAGLPVAMAP